MFKKERKNERKNKQKKKINYLLDILEITHVTSYENATN